VDQEKNGTMIHTHYLDLATRLKKKIQVVLNKKRNFLPSNFVCPKDNFFLFQ